MGADLFQNAIRSIWSLNSNERLKSVFYCPLPLSGGALADWEGEGRSARGSVFVGGLPRFPLPVCGGGGEQAEEQQGSLPTAKLLPKAGSSIGQRNGLALKQRSKQVAPKMEGIPQWSSGTGWILQEQVP